MSDDLSWFSRVPRLVIHGEYTLYPTLAVYGPLIKWGFSIFLPYREVTLTKKHTLSYASNI